MKTVNILSTHFFPEKSAGANRINSLVKKLSEEYIVNIIYLVERGKVVNLEMTKKQFNNNVNLYPILQNNFKGSSFIKRIFYETLYSIKLNIKNLLVKSDITIVSVPYLMLLPVSGLFSFFYKRKKILEIRDLIWLYLDFSDKKILQKAKVILEKLCIWSVNKFDILVTTTQSQLDYFERDGIVISNGIEKLKFEELSLLEYPSNKDKIYITYAGTIGFPQNLMLFVEAANYLKNDNRYIFNIAGKGNDLNRILKYINDKKLTNVNFLGELNWQELKELYSNSHILYAQLKDTISFRTAQPSKIFEYASTGFPLIFGGVGESEQIINKLENSILIKPDNVQELVNVILEFDNKNKSKYNVKYILDNYIRENLIIKYNNILNNEGKIDDNTRK